MAAMTAGLAFAGTLGLASVLTQQRNAPLVVVGEDLEWPFTLKLPAGYDLALAESTPGDGDRHGGLAVFRRAFGSHTRSVEYRYGWLSPGTMPSEALVALTGSDPTMIDGSAMIGREPAVRVIGETDDHIVFVAASCRADGLALSVGYQVEPIRARLAMWEARFTDICNAVEFHDAPH